MIEDSCRKTRHKTYGIRRAAKWILARYELGSNRWHSKTDVVFDRVKQLWSKPLKFERYMPEHENADHWMSFQVYRVAVVVSRETDWEFIDDDEDDPSPGVFYSQVDAYQKQVAREVAEAEAHMYTIQILYDRVFDIAPELANTVLKDAAAVDECVHFFMDVMDIDFDRMMDEEIDFPLSTCIPDSPDYTREALGLWPPHVVASAKLLVKFWNVQAGIPPPREPLPRDPEPRMTVRLQSVSMSRGRRTREARAAARKENDQTPILVGRAPLPTPDEQGREAHADQPVRARPRYEPPEDELAPPWRLADAVEQRPPIAPPPGLSEPVGGAHPSAPGAPIKGHGKGQGSPYVQADPDLANNPWSSMTDEPSRYDADRAASADTSAPTWYVPPGHGRDLPRTPTGSRRQPAASHSVGQDDVMPWPRSYARDQWRSDEWRAWRDWGDEHDVRYQQELRDQARRDGVSHWNHGRWCPYCRTFGAEWDPSCGLCGFRWSD